MAANRQYYINKQLILGHTTDSRIKRFVSVNRSSRVERVKNLSSLDRREGEVKANIILASVFGIVLIAFVALITFLYTQF